ncbi:hypothetical protein FC96_GL002453 [Secundilactobacillus kimchicus JCM 15530]|uniref:Surface layer protein A domain-containing protein n=1 Tax=Secundilactobacillus kimchicus JCM 15530 TaxID=1302272 RepID=A0A0R1HXG9_9LACO|nr:hypothetical protein [Secundilactobacillus kimchicus]KRK47527.1 hypothetical protein FC96_GL002453 [Secundilactobacillus kimchicus JCM 15530]
MFISKKRVVSTLAITIGLIGLATSIQANAKTTFEDYYAVTTKATKALPKGTRVQVYRTATKNGKQFASVDVSRLSYEVQKRAGNKYSVVIATANLKKIATPASDKLTVLSKGAKYTTDARYKAANKLKVTTDGYVQYFANSFKKAPISSTKLTASRAKGNIVYLYSKTNMAKLPDKHIHKHGNYQYRLAIRDNQKQDELSQSYSVGTLKNLFYDVTMKA